jgi:Cu/Ag efflux protein CusF
MKKLVIPFAAAVMFAGIGFASAETATGAIKALDPATFTITLEDGSAYVVDPKTDLMTMKAGDKVQITFDVKEGKNVATAIAPAPAQ